MTAKYWRELRHATRVKWWVEWAAILVPTIGAGAVIAIIFITVWNLVVAVAA